MDRGRGEVDFGIGLVDFLEVKRDVHRCWGLIKVISVRPVTGQSEKPGMLIVAVIDGRHSPHCLYLLLASRLALANKQMLLLLMAPLDFQKLVKLQHPLLAARPSLAPFVENRLPGMMHAFLLLPRHRWIVSHIAAFPATSSICWNLQIRVIGVRFFRDRCRSRSRRSRGNGSRSRRFSSHRFGRRRGIFSLCSS